MDFVAWCDHVLQEFIKLSDNPLHYEAIQHLGVWEALLTSSLFGPESLIKPRPKALDQAIHELEGLGLIEQFRRENSWRVRREAREYVSDPTNRWSEICSRLLTDDEADFLSAVNRLSSASERDDAQLEEISYYAVRELLRAPEGISRVYDLAHDLASIHFVKPIGDSVRSTYPGLVWETRRGLIGESKWLDGLVDEWETTSVEFKRELSMKTAREQAQLVTRVLGLANTQASGRRWLIIGFDDETHQYYGPPNPDLEADHFERLMAEYTAPCADVRYRVMDYRLGKVGVLEVKRDPMKLPYVVRRSIKGERRRNKRLIIKGQRFVRHGSQTEKPTRHEWKAIMEEGQRARSTPR